MTISRHVGLAATAVVGLLFLAGTGCGPKNEGEKVAIQFLQRDLAKAEADKAKYLEYANCVRRYNTADEREKNCPVPM